MGCRAAGRDNRKIRPFETKHDGQVSRDHVNDRARDEKRGYPARAVLLVSSISVFNHRQAADAGADIDSNALAFQSGSTYIVDTRIFDSLDPCSHSVMD